MNQDDPTCPDENCVHIKLSVVANIVKLATLEVEGVQSVSGGKMEGLLESIGAKKGGGVAVEEDGQGSYKIAVHLDAYFGFSLTDMAKEVQKHIREQIEKMTGKPVVAIDVFVDDVKMKAPEISTENVEDHWTRQE